MQTSLLLSAIALIVVTVAVEAPAKFSGLTDRPWHYLLIATAINALRIPALGVAIGAAAGRSAGSAARRRDPHPEPRTIERSEAP